MSQPDRKTEPYVHVGIRHLQPSALLVLWTQDACRVAVRHFAECKPTRKHALDDMQAALREGMETLAREATELDRMQVKVSIQGALALYWKDAEALIPP